jgi:hypothetical protein
MTKRLFAHQHRKLKYKLNYDGFAPGRSFREWVSHLTTLRRGRQWKPAAGSQWQGRTIRGRRRGLHNHSLMFPSGFQPDARFRRQRRNNI